MLTSITIRNFRSLRDVTLVLRDRNILIGPNKSGKTSFLDSLRFICQAMTFGDIAKPLADRGGLASVFWRGSKDEIARPPSPSIGPIEFELEGDLETENAQSMNFSYLLSTSGDLTGRVSIQRELLDITIASSTHRLIDMTAGEGVAKRIDGTHLFTNTGNRQKPALSYDIPGWEAQLIKNMIVLWQFFDIIPQLARATSNTAAAITVVDQHGSNLSSWIHTLQVNYPDEFSRISRLFTDAFPEVESLGTVVTQAGTTFLTLREKFLQSPISIFDASNGELMFLLLVSLIHSPFGVPLICIEEPENHLHPRLLALLVEIANQRRYELRGQISQAVVTTHSPYLVDLLEPEDIVLVEKHRGETFMRRPASADELRRLMRESESTLGRLWFSGSLGTV